MQIQTQENVRHATKIVKLVQTVLILIVYYVKMIIFYQ